MLNENLFYFLNNLAGRHFFLDLLIIFGARYLIVFLIFASAILLYRISKQAILTLLISLVLAVIIGQLFKFFFQLPRPFIVNDVRLLFYPPSSSTFPSDHAFLASVAASSLFLYRKKIGFAALFAAFLVGFSRVSAGIHWPSDVLAGWLSGFLLSWAVKKLLAI